MKPVELPQFLQDGSRLLEAGMSHRLITSHTGQGQTAESLGNLHAAGSLINAPLLIHVRLATVVRTMASQVVSDPHQHAPQPAVGLPDDRPTIMIRLIALMT